MFDKIDTVLIGTSLSEMSDDVVRAGLNVARSSGARVCLVHAFLPHWAYNGGPYLSESFIQETLEVERSLAEKNLREQADRLGIRAEEIVRLIVAYGPPHRVVMDAAEEVSADLLVVGSTESPQLSKLFGSTADRVIRKANRPVLMVRGPLRSPLRRVLLPVDLSPVSAAAFRRGLSVLTWIAPDLDTRFEAVFVASPRDRGLMLEERGTALPADMAEQSDLERFVARNAAWCGREIETRLLYGEVEEEIRNFASGWNADLIVVGTHGRGGFERFLLGSVAADVVRRGPASVLVIPPEPAPEAVRPQVGEKAAAAVGTMAFI